MCNPFTGDYVNEEQWLENHYHCSHCNESWTDHWYCEVDTDCPSCQRPNAPTHSQLEMINGDLEAQTVDAEPRFLRRSIPRSKIQSSGLESQD